MAQKSQATFPHLLLAPGKIQQQFYLALKKHIQTGALAPGTKLPSSRSFASMMGISRNSVLAGLDRLSDEGYLYTRAGSGTYVALALPEQFIQIQHTASQSVANTHPLASSTNQTQVLKAQTSSAAMQISSRIQSLQATWTAASTARGEQRMFSIGIGCCDLFPHQLWGRLLARAWRQFSKQAHHTQVFGFLPLRQAICDYMHATRGVQCRPEQVLIVNGTQQAINLTAQVLLDQGDEVCIDEPGYDAARGALLAQGAQVRPVDSDSEGMKLEDVIQHWPNSKMIYSTPSHQFPLGGTLSLSRRLALLAWAADQNRWIFEDDYNSEFRYHAQPIQALQGLDQQQRVIYAGTFSKMLLPELRLGFLIIPTQLIDAFQWAKHYADTRSAYLEQATLAMFISEGHYARHVRRVRKACAERQQTLMHALALHLSDYVQIEANDSGIHVLAWLKAPYTEQQFLTICAEIGLGVQALSRYYQQQPQAQVQRRQGILFGFAAHTPTEIDQAIQQLAEALQAASISNSS